MTKQASDYKKMVALSAFLAPLIGGAIIYYSLIKSHEEIAKFGNNVSLLAFVTWIPVNVGLSKVGLSWLSPLPIEFDSERVTITLFHLFGIGGLIGLGGIVLAIMTVKNIKQSSS